MAAPLSITIPHQLGKDEARRRLETMMTEMSSQVPGMSGWSQEWAGDRLSFETQVMGQKISGWAEVAAEMIHLEMLLPGFLGMMAGQLKEKIERRGTILLEGPKSP